MTSLPHRHTLLEDGSGIRLRGWTVRSGSGPIAKAAEIAELEVSLKDVKLPGMVFPSAYLTLQHENADLRLSFKPQGALSRIGKSPPDPSLQVAAASAWQKRLLERSEPLPTIAGDWTFTSNYSGDLSIGGRQQEQSQNGAPQDVRQAIDYDLCRKQDIPILYFGDVMLYEDELDDNGAVSMNVRVRVMPTFFLVLMRHWLRVDGVTARCIESRWFHVFGEPVLICERQVKSCSADVLRGVHFAVQRDPDKMQEHMTVNHTESFVTWVENLT